MPTPTLLHVDTAMPESFSPLVSSPSFSSLSTGSSSSHSAPLSRRDPSRKPDSTSNRHDNSKTDASKPRRRLSCSSPRCSSPVASPSSRSGASPSPRPGSPPAPTSPPMSMTTYFSLLKKSQVLEQLLRLSGHASARELELQRLEREKSRADCVHARVFADLTLFQAQYVDAQKCALELLEQLTALCMAGSNDQQDAGGSESGAASEERTLRDLQRVMAANNSNITSTSTSASTFSGGADTVSVETQALRAVGCDRVRQLKEVMRNYERQLVRLEGELSRAIHSSAVVDLTTRVRELEARGQRHIVDKVALEDQLRRSKDQQRDLQTRLDQLQDDHVALDAEKRATDQLLEAQSAAIEQFGTALRAELRRRYGTVPSVLEHRWREFFPTIPLPL